MWTRVIEVATRILPSFDAEYGLTFVVFTVFALLYIHFIRTMEES